MTEESYGGYSRKDWEKAAAAGDMRFFYTACKLLAGDKAEWTWRWAEALIPEAELKTLKAATVIMPPYEESGKPIPETKAETDARFARMEQAKAVLKQRIQDSLSENRHTLDVRYENFEKWRMQLLTKAIAHNPFAAFYNAQEIIPLVGTGPLEQAADDSHDAAVAAIASFAHYGYVNRDIRLSQIAGNAVESTITEATHEVNGKLLSSAHSLPARTAGEEAVKMADLKTARDYDANAKIGEAVWDQGLIQAQSPEVQAWAQKMVLHVIRKYPSIVRDHTSLIATLPFEKEAREAAGEHHKAEHHTQANGSGMIWGPEQQRRYVEQAYGSATSRT